MQPVISVFGSSSPRPGEAAYEEARTVGHLLARQGFVVATGGYNGTMEATSRGAAEAGGHVIGVTAAQIERFRPLGPNRYVKQVVRYETLRERLIHLVMQNDGMIVLPGGIGTLSEMTLAWSFLQVGEISQRPLVLVGAMWQETLRAFVRSEYVPERHQALVQFAATPQDAVSLLGTGAASREGKGQ